MYITEKKNCLSLGCAFGFSHMLILKPKNSRPVNRHRMMAYMITESDYTPECVGMGGFPWKEMYYHIAHAGLRKNLGKEIDWSHLKGRVRQEADLPRTPNAIV